MNLSVHSLYFSYQAAPLLRDLDFSLDTGSFVCVLGKNGAGKSTLFQCILNLQKNYTGMISLDGQNVKALKEKELAKKEKADKALMTGTVILSVVLSVGLFIVLPYLLASLLRNIGVSETGVTLAEAGVRIVLFLAYMLLISKMQDIQRVFMYHGAEHKCINCVEHGLPLNVENVMKSSRFHKRCGTSFLFFVIIISIIFFLGFFAVVPIKTMWLRVLVRILLVPVIAGVSYEVIRLAGNSDNSVVAFFSKPGMALQKLTTKEPTPDMAEVAIKAVEAVFDWKAYLKENFPDVKIDEEC